MFCFLPLFPRGSRYRFLYPLFFKLERGLLGPNPVTLGYYLDESPAHRILEHFGVKLLKDTSACSSVPSRGFELVTSPQLYPLSYSHPSYCCPWSKCSQGNPNTFVMKILLIRPETGSSLNSTWSSLSQTSDLWETHAEHIYITKVM